MIQLPQNPLAQVNVVFDSPPRRTCISLNPALERSCSIFAARVYGSVICRAVHRFEEGLPLAYVLALAGVGFMDASKHELHMMGAAGESWEISGEERWREALRREKTWEERRIIITSRGVAMARQWGAGEEAVMSLETES